MNIFCFEIVNLKDKITSIELNIFNIKPRLYHKPKWFKYINIPLLALPAPNFILKLISLMPGNGGIDDKWLFPTNKFVNNILQPSILHEKTSTKPIYRSAHFFKKCLNNKRDS